MTTRGNYEGRHAPETPTRSSPGTSALVDKWRSEAKRHREAEAEAAGNGDEEAFLHGVEADRLEKCAAELAGVAQPLTSPETGGLLERLRNPMWVHGNVPFLSPQLDKEENLAAMNDAADEIERLIENCVNAVTRAWTGNDFALRDQVIEAIRAGHGAAQQPAVDVRKLLGAFYKTVDVMKSARNSESKTMNVWADDMKAIEDVMLFLETLRDAGPAQAQRPLPQDVARLIDGEAFQDAHDALTDSWWSYRRDIALRKADAIISSWDDLCSMSATDKREGGK